MKRYSRTLPLLGLCTLMGCAAPLTKSAKDSAAAAEVRQQAGLKQMEYKQRGLEAEASSVPDWAMMPAQPDAHAYYGVGIGADNDMLLSMRKARLQGLYDIATTLSAELSAEEAMGGTGRTDYRYLIDLFVKRVNVSGYELVKQEVRPVNGKFRTYTLLKLSHDQINKAMGERLGGSLDRSHARLMRRLAKADQTLPPGANAEALPPRGAVPVDDLACVTSGPSAEALAKARLYGKLAETTGSVISGNTKVSDAGVETGANQHSSVFVRGDTPVHYQTINVEGNSYVCAKFTQPVQYAE